MPGQRVPITARESYDFSNLGANQELQLMLAKTIDATAFRQGQALVRVHANSIAAGGSLAIEVSPADPAPDDPHGTSAPTCPWRPQRSPAPQPLRRSSPYRLAATSAPPCRSS